jgi:hypothetical protein
MSDNIDSDEISLKEVILKTQKWWHYLLSKWKVILIISMIGGLAGLTYSLLEKPVYKAETKFVLQNEKSNGGLSGALGMASQFGLDLNSSGGGEFSGDNILLLMKSRSMVEQALLAPVIIKNKRTNLINYYIDYNKLNDKDKPENIYFLSNVDRSKFTIKQDSLLGVIYKSLITNNIVVDRVDKKSSIISLKVTSTNELFSKVFTELLTDVVSNFYIKTTTEKGSENVAVLQHQVDSVRALLNSAISGVASSLDVTPNPNPSLLTLRVPSQRRAVDVTANTAILNELVKQLIIAKTSLLQETPLIQVIDKPILPLDKAKTGKLKCTILGVILSAFLISGFIILKSIYKSFMISN